MSSPFRIAAVALVLALSGVSSQQPMDLVERATSLRTAIVDGNKTWADARRHGDRATFERMLAPDFYAQFPGRRATRQEFIESISGSSPESRLVRFEPSVLTIVSVPNGGDAIISEKLEIEHTKADGTKSRDYQLWITRDRWRQIDGAWKILSTEALGVEGWRGNPPPMRDWK